MLIDYELTPPDRQTKGAEHLTASSDCVPVFLGLAAGTASAELAARKGGIVKVHQVGMSRNYVLIAGTECVYVRGEFSQAALDDYRREEVTRLLFSDRELDRRIIRGVSSKDDLRYWFGSPHRIEGATWVYEGRQEGQRRVLRVTFDERGKVASKNLHHTP